MNGPIKPDSLERVAQSYAVLIKAGEKSLDDVPLIPARLKPRVEELIE